MILVHRYANKFCSVERTIDPYTFLKVGKNIYGKRERVHTL